MESSSPQTAHPSLTGVDEPAKQPDRIELIAESRKRIGDELARLMMNPTSTVQWAKHNPFRNGDRFRNFLYHCLLWQYYVYPVPQTKLSKEDERHFILLCRFVSEWWHYNTHEKNNISDDDEFIKHVKKCVIANVNDPVQGILHIEVPHVFDTMRAWVDEFGKHSGPRLPRRKSIKDFTLEAAAEKGRWEEVGKRVAYDVKLVDIVTPYDDQEARQALMKAVRKRQQYYLERASRNV
jgi:hypothetical protein